MAAVKDDDVSEIVTASFASLDFAATSVKLSKKKRRRQKTKDNETSSSAWIQDLLVHDDGEINREELLLCQRNKRRCGYAELLSQSKSCANRRANSAVSCTQQRSLHSRFVRGDHVCLRRDVASAGLSQHTIPEIITEEERGATVDSVRCPPIPLGSGTLGQMELTHQRPRHGSVLSTRHPSMAAEAYSNNDQDNDDEFVSSSDLPAPDLVDYVRFLANQRCFQEQQKQLRMKQEHVNIVPGSDSAPDNDSVLDAVSSPPPHLELESSAAIAVAILVEELARDFMVSWASRQQRADKDSGDGVGALMKPSKRRVKVAASLQLAGALPSSIAAVTDDASDHSLSQLLRNRLEVRMRTNDITRLFLYHLYSIVFVQLFGTSDFDSDTVLTSASYRYCLVKTYASMMEQLLGWLRRTILRHISLNNLSSKREAGRTKNKNNDDILARCKVTCLLNSLYFS